MKDSTRIPYYRSIELATMSDSEKEDYNKKISEKGTIKRLLDTLVERIEINSKTNEPTLIYVESFEKLYKLYKEN